MRNVIILVPLAIAGWQGFTQYQRRALSSSESVESRKATCSAGGT